MKANYLFGILCTRGAWLESLLAQRMYRGSSWFCSDSPVPQTRPRPLSAKPFPNHHSLIVITIDALPDIRHVTFMATDFAQL
jgi:hypothetical protein